MRFPLGYGILLVLILGLVSIQPLNCYQQQSNEEQQQQQQQQSGSELESAQKLPEGAAEVSGPELASAAPVPAELPAGSPEVAAASAAAPAEEELTSQEQGEIAELASQQAKRNLGMPGGSRELSGPPEGLAPANQSPRPVESDGKSGEQEPPASQQQQPEESSSQEESKKSPGGNNLPVPPPLPPASKGQTSSARAMMSPANNPGQQQAVSGQAGKQQAAGVRREDLPTIIENNKPSKPQEASQNQQQQQQNQQQQVASSSSLVEGDSSMALNGSLPMSSARTFDSWTNCVGAASNKYGTCKNDVECNKNKGTADGSCMGGLGVCCIVALSCGDKSFENNTFFANSDYPEPSWEARLCEVELKKKHSKILQIMIEFVEFELAPPNHEGECITDVFQVKLASNRPSPYSLLRICGQNTGQHMYLDVSQVDEPLLLSVATSGGGFPRRWSIRIVQMDDKNHLLAPPGCLQYYTDTIGHFRSFNLGRNLRNLYYAICFRIDNGYSGIRFTENFFGMNGPFCRKRLGGGHGRHNNSGIIAHPHHLVIPPPGYSTPLPPPGHHPHHLNPEHHFNPEHHLHQEHHPGKFQHHQPEHHLQHHQPEHHLQHHQPPPPVQLEVNYQQQQPALGRYKRFAYAETLERQTRTHHEHDHHHEPKEIHHHHHIHSEKPIDYKHPDHLQPPPPPPQYGQYSPPPPTYGPPLPPPNYYDSKIPGDYKLDKVEDKFHFNKGPHHHQPHHNEHESKNWGFHNAFGWVGAKKDDKFEKFDKFDKFEHGKYPPHDYKGYNEGYPHQGYGYNQHYEKPGYNPHHLQNHHPHGGYKYHHKEIDKFGKQYEHLEYKHEKNHSGADKDTKSSWWPSWGSAKKDEKKLEKFQQHHEALFPLIRIPEMPHCEPRFCGGNDVITFPPSGDSIAEMCGNRFNRGKGPKIISGSPLVVYVSNRGHNRGAGFDMNYEQVFYIPRPY